MLLAESFLAFCYSINAANNNHSLKNKHIYNNMCKWEHLNITKAVNSCLKMSLFQTSELEAADEPPQQRHRASAPGRDRGLEEGREERSVQ